MRDPRDSCPQCGRMVKNVSRHVRENHSVDRKQFSCDLCIYATRRKDNFNRHYKNVHPNKQPSPAIITSVKVKRESLEIPFTEKKKRGRPKKTDIYQLPSSNTNTNTTTTTTTTTTTDPSHANSPYYYPTSLMVNHNSLPALGSNSMSFPSSIERSTNPADTFNPTSYYRSYSYDDSTTDSPFERIHSDQSHLPHPHHHRHTHNKSSTPQLQRTWSSDYKDQHKAAAAFSMANFGQQVNLPSINTMLNHPRSPESVADNTYFHQDYSIAAMDATTIKIEDTGIKIGDTGIKIEDSNIKIPSASLYSDALQNQNFSSPQHTNINNNFVSRMSGVGNAPTNWLS
ncbi:hypothetical protein DASC09_043220 [Saccharomycopsis crataegensis]|uniref:C2H2-type domain-containing protein n=1 Tax=Saccharomycopsis crataegensis TaxID=43959 RepID=A0AAV5QRA7_9ASCO|nr:hypothetical protein DASC09_043220 [Saccharomycopsis crataegensis]